MLKLNRIIRYTSKEKKYLKFLKAEFGGNFTGKSWYDDNAKTQKLKSKISYLLHTNQKFRCAYCEKLLIRDKKEIDHIAPLHEFPQYCFTCINLVYACSNCNAVLKNQKKIITNRGNLQKNYKHNSFWIVHPYLDDPDLHIKYQDKDKVYLDLPSCSVWGIKTIDIFDLDGLEMRYFRAGELQLQKKFPISDKILNTLILKAVSYRKK